MRKLLAFLLLFGGGLYALWYIERRTGGPPEEDPPPSQQELPVSVGNRGERGPGVQIGGAFNAILYDDEKRGDEELQRTVLQVRSDESVTEGDVDVLYGVALELYDPKSPDESKQADVVAGTVRLQRLVEGLDHELRWENRVLLEDVEATFLREVFLAPLDFAAARAVLDAEDARRRRIETDDPFTITSPKLDASGVGLVLHLDDDLAEVRAKGRVDLHRTDESSAEGPLERSARLSALERGALQIRSVPGSEPRVFVVQAWEGTLLEVEGERAARLEARETTLRATSGESDGLLVLDRLDATGDVRVTLGDNLFRGREAEIQFDAQGEPARALLTGLPRAVFPLPLDEGWKELSASGQAIEEPTVDVVGEETLEVVWEEGYRVRVVGPTTLETRGLSVRAAQGLSGFRATDGSSARFDVTNGVVLETDRGILETANLEIDLESDAAGRAVFVGRASGGARIVGALSDGRPFAVTTPEGLVVAGTPDGWIVREGTQIEVTIGPLPGEEKGDLYARADRVRDVDLEELAFRAFGNVRYRTEIDERRHELAADELTAHRTLTAEANGSNVTRYELDARGAVRGTIGDDTVRGETLRGIHVERRSPGAPLEVETELELTREVDVRVALEEGELELQAERVEVRRRIVGEEVVREDVKASDDVRFQGRRGIPFSGHGDLLTLDVERRGRLASEDGRVHLAGELPADQTEDRLPFEMTATEVVFAGDEVTATSPLLDVEGYRAEAQRMRSDGVSVELEGDVRAYGETRRGVPWTLLTQKLRLEGKAQLDKQARGEAGAGADVRALFASGGIDFELGEVLRARGESLEYKKIHGTMRFEGAPVTVDSPFAHLTVEWVEFDPDLQMIVGTGPGRVLPAQPTPPPPTPPGTSVEPTVDEGGTNGGHRPTAVEAGSDVRYVLVQEEPEPEAQKGTVLDFLSTSTQFDVELDSLVFLVQEPVFRSPAIQTELRASWAVLWIDRERWVELQDQGMVEGGIVEELRTSFEDLGERSESGTPIPELFELFQAGPLNQLVHEAYFEGPVELVEKGDLLFRADAVYLDVVLNRGWLAKATVNLYGRLVGQDFDKLIVKTDWLRHDLDGTLRARDATVTSCTFDEPHLKVVTGDLRIEPQPEATARHGAFRLVMEQNRVELYDLLRIPLPTIDVGADEEFRPLWRTLSIANSARFGTALSLGFERPAGKAGEAVDGAIGKKDEPYEATFKFEASYLGSRGGLFDLGLVSHSDSYWFDTFVGLVYDTGDDRGFIRVPEEDRSEVRYWLRSQGSFYRGNSALSLVVSDQSDAAVQSEFYEGEFLAYELDESYLEWRRSKGEWFTSIAVEPRVDSFRSEIEELPSVTAFHSRAPVFRIGGQVVNWIGDATAAYLRRREGGRVGTDLDGDGNPDPLQSPFGLPFRFPDGLGARDLVRVDTRQALEAPVPLGTAGLRLTPFVRTRGTYWDEGVNAEASPYRLIAEGGARLATTLWRANSDGTLHQVVPYVGVRAELGREDNATPLALDEVEDVLTGDLFELGTRARFGTRGGRSVFDVDLRATYAAGRSDGASDGWLPFGVFTRLDVEPFGRRFELWYDARVDLENGDTDYSLVSLGTRIGQRFGLQAGHQRGRAVVGGRSLFETATLEAIYRWTEKWEFQGRQAFSLLDDQELDLFIALRRYGHDIVLDLETSVREGEGTSVGISVRPRFGYDRPRIGYVPW